MCVQAYEGKGVDDSTFYSCMKDILGDQQPELLDDFVALIRPEGCSEVPTCDEPSVKEDFPFNVDQRQKKSRSSEDQRQLQQQLEQEQQQLQLLQQQLLVQAAQVVPAPARPNATLNSTEVTALVKTAVSDKAKVTHY